jgi:hypothetical protein
MENPSANKSLSDSILEITKSATQSADAVATTAVAATTEAATTAESSGFLGLSLLTWLVIIMVLAFLGFNIFSYLSQGSAYLAAGTQEVTGIFAPLLRMIFGTSVAVTGETIDVAAEGGKAVVSTTAAGVNTGLSAVQDVTPNKASGSVQSTSVEEDNQDMEEAKSSLNKALSKNKSNEDGDYEPNEAASSIHETGKAGWCFIGEDRGHRTCSKVSETDKCMSGDIFPSQQICINPSLRP